MWPTEFTCARIKVRRVSVSLTFPRMKNKSQIADVTHSNHVDATLTKKINNFSRTAPIRTFPFSSSTSLRNPYPFSPNFPLIESASLNNETTTRGGEILRPKEIYEGEDILVLPYERSLFVFKIHRYHPDLPKQKSRLTDVHHLWRQFVTFW